MPSPKSGKAGTAVAPAVPVEALEADVADPGKVDEIKAEQREAQAGKYGAASLKPFKSSESKPGEDKDKPKGWIAIKMLDEDGNPVVGLAYRIVLPDGETAATGTLDEKGAARVEGFEPGSCKVSFPSLDRDAWIKK